MIKLRNDFGAGARDDICGHARRFGSSHGSHRLWIGVIGSAVSRTPTAGQFPWAGVFAGEVEGMMAGRDVYDISRYDASADQETTHQETMVGHARLRSDNGELKLIVGDGPETACTTGDIAGVIGADPRSGCWHRTCHPR